MKINSAQGILFKHISDKTIDELSVLQLNQIREAMKEYAEQFIDLAISESYNLYTPEEYISIVEVEELEKVKQLIK